MGILGGLTGLAGIVTTVWCGMRGWGKDEQRAVFQPVGVAVIATLAQAVMSRHPPSKPSEVR